MSVGSRRSTRGFTFIEVMMVVSLIAVLLGIGMPVYDSYRERARVTQAANDIAVLSANLHRYSLDNRGFPESLEQVGAGQPLDPWGRPYVYYNVESNGRGGARKDRRLNPLNTDFDLYSLGKDGKTKPQISQRDSEDDVIRASNGRYVGKAADY